MNEMVEPVAKAIRNNGSVRYGTDWENVPEDAKDMFRQDARAAIAAMQKYYREQYGYILSDILPDIDEDPV